MFDGENISQSSQSFLEKTGHSIIDLFNEILLEEVDMRQLICENGISFG